MALVACGRLSRAEGRPEEAREEWLEAIAVVDSLPGPATGFDAPRARVEALVALGRAGEARRLAGELLRSGYREAPFVRLIRENGLTEAANTDGPR
jgi:hypothetical protein